MLTNARDALPSSLIVALTPKKVSVPSTVCDNLVKSANNVVLELVKPYVLSFSIIVVIAVELSSTPLISLKVASCTTLLESVSATILPFCIML